MNKDYTSVEQSQKLIKLGIIANLPNDVEFERYIKLQDFLHSDYNVAESLSEYPFFCENDGEVQITGIDRIDGTCRDLVDGVCISKWFGDWWCENYFALPFGRQSC